MTEENIISLIQRELAKSNGVPVGAIFAFPSETIPEGYLPCEGQELAISQYPVLYKLIGTTFGGTTKTFNLPDLQGQFIRGLDREGNIDIKENGSLRELGDKQEDALQGHSHSTSSETTSDGYHSHSTYFTQSEIKYGSNTFSDNESRDVYIPRDQSFYHAHQKPKARYSSSNLNQRIHDMFMQGYYHFSVEESERTGTHTHKFSISGVCNDTYGIARVSSETRPTNIALVFCIKVK